MISKELEERIVATMDEDANIIRAAATEELLELAQVLLKIQRHRGYFVERATGKTMQEKLIEEIADVLVSCVMLWSIYGLRGRIYDQIHEIIKRYEDYV